VKLFVSVARVSATLLHAIADELDPDLAEAAGAVAESAAKPKVGFGPPSS